MPTAPHLDFAGEVKKMVNVPIFHASKINDISTIHKDCKLYIIYLKKFKN